MVGDLKETGYFSTGFTGWTGRENVHTETKRRRGEGLTTKYTNGTKGEGRGNREEGVEEIAGRYNLQPAGDFPLGIASDAELPLCFYEPT